MRGPAPSNSPGVYLNQMETGIEVDILVEETAWESVGLDQIAGRVGAGISKELGLPGGFEISLLACDDDRIASLNSDFRDTAGPTNVLSWPSRDLSAGDEGDMPQIGAAEQELGDIAIAYETCAREAEEQGKSLEDHTAHLLLHGILHLLGFDHIRPKDADLMESLESRILAKLGIADPYGS